MQQERSASLPDSVYARLVSQLYETRLPLLFNSSLAMLLVGGFTAWYTADAIIAWLTAASSALVLSLLLVWTAFPTAAVHQSPEIARSFELRFGLVCCGVTAGVGLICARTFVVHHDSTISMLVAGWMLATSGTLLRNHYRPRIVFCQLASLIVPSVIGMVWHAEPVNIVLAIGTLAFAYNVVEITQGLYRNAVAAFMNDDRLREQAFRFEAALTNMAQGLCMFDGNERLVVCNTKYLDMYGFSGAVVKPGVSLRELVEHSVAIGNHADRSADVVYAGVRAHWAVGLPSSFRHQSRGGRVFSITHEPMPDGGWVATHEDITERQKVEARIVHMARHDALTGLPNRVQFREALDAALKRAGDIEQVAVLCLDLDRFKAVNDTLGHPVGDGLLIQVAERLQRCLHPADMLARLSGDEFAIVQTVGRQPSSARKLAQKLVDVVSGSFEIDGHQILTGTSVGVALAPADGRDADTILKHADLALYRAKGDGRGRYRFYAADMNERMQVRRQLEIDLRQALRSGGFSLHYQPLFCAQKLGLAGFEALLRWDHPSRGTVPPGEFVPLAEEIGLIVPLGEWVLREALFEAARWPEHIKVAVNLSPAQFRSGRLVHTVTHALATSGVDPARLELEITEGVLLADTESALATLHRLRSLGVRTAMDDFGTGYSSLSYLRSFPFDKLKIDQSFVRDIGNKAEAEAIVRTTIALAKSLGMSTTAEGVETEEQLQLLREEGCAEVQGYLLGRPDNADAARTLLARSPNHKREQSVKVRASLRSRAGASEIA